MLSSTKGFSDLVWVGGVGFSPDKSWFDRQAFNRLYQVPLTSEQHGYSGAEAH